VDFQMSGNATYPELAAVPPFSSDSFRFAGSLSANARLDSCTIRWSFFSNADYKIRLGVR
jgi:hypothetical protein